MDQAGHNSLLQCWEPHLEQNLLRRLLLKRDGGDRVESMCTQKVLEGFRVLALSAARISGRPAP